MEGNGSLHVLSPRELSILDLIFFPPVERRPSFLLKNLQATVSKGMDNRIVGEIGMHPIQWGEGEEIYL